MASPTTATSAPTQASHVPRALPPGIRADAVHPGMYRARLADGTFSDMANLSRAVDALRRHA